MASDPLIENLLVLQERDVHRDEIQHRLDDIPLRIASFERDIAASRAALQGRLDEQKALELKKRDLELKIAEAEEQLVRFRTQQMAVKKNDEYAAMDKQIEAAGHLIDHLETETMEVMLKIDEFALVVQQQKAATNAEIAILKGNIDSLSRVRASLQNDIAEATANAEAVRDKVPPDALSTYLYVKTRVKRPPYIVPLEDMRCMGCHLKVSNDVQTQARLVGKLTRCDSCGRIVYLGR